MGDNLQKGIVDVVRAVPGDRDLRCVCRVVRPDGHRHFRRKHIGGNGKRVGHFDERVVSGLGDSDRDLLPWASRTLFFLIDGRHGDGEVEVGGPWAGRGARRKDLCTNLLLAREDF